LQSYNENLLLGKAGNFSFDNDLQRQREKLFQDNIDRKQQNPALNAIIARESLNLNESDNQVHHPHAAVQDELKSSHLDQKTTMRLRNKSLCEGGGKHRFPLFELVSKVVAVHAPPAPVHGRRPPTSSSAQSEARKRMLEARQRRMCEIE
jgi:hypothetical protein